jgi:uncharacterized protein
MNLEKLNLLRSHIRALESAVVAFSGGVDSTLLAKLTWETLGERSIAVTICSPSLPVRERDGARRLAAEIGIKHIEVESNELDDPAYLENTPLRCYWCKRTAFGLIAAYARQNGFAWVLDGNNLDDMTDTRPGRKAAEELGIRSPLIELGVTKSEVREFSQHLGLPNWNKPAMACLSSRVPYGTPIDRKTLSQIEAGENVLNDFGLSRIRLRHHGAIARIEIEPAEFGLLLQHREEIVDRLVALGFTYITLDLAGYRTGSMNLQVGSKNES